jgi:hypothetical protein
MTPTAFSLQKQIASAFKHCLQDRPEVLKAFGSELSQVVKNIAARIDNDLTMDIRNHIRMEADLKIKADTDLATVLSAMECKIASLEKSNKYLLARLKEAGIKLNNKE